MQITFRKIAQNLRLANLNLFIPVFVLADVFLNNLVMLVLMIMMSPLNSIMSKDSRWEFVATHVLIFLVVAIIFCLNSVSPRLIQPKRERRFRIGHWIIAVSSLAEFLSIAIPVALAMLWRAEAGLYIFASAPVIAIGFFTWIGGLYMVLSSRATPAA